MYLSILPRIILTISLLFLYHSIQPRVDMVYPYIPPLAHTPGMGVSMLGIHSPPKYCNQCQELRIKEATLLTQTHQYRLDMQEQVIELLKVLPQDTPQRARRERNKNEEILGEVLVWKNNQLP